MQKSSQLRVFVVKGVVDGIGGHDCRQGEVAGRQSLRQTQEVGADGGLLAGEHGPGAPEADSDLIGDEMNSVPVASLAQEPQVYGVIHPHVARALHQRLENHRSGFVRMACQRGFHLRKLATRVVLPALTGFALVTVRGRNGDDVHQQRAIDLFV